MFEEDTSSLRNETRGRTIFHDIVNLGESLNLLRRLVGETDNDTGLDGCLFAVNAGIKKK